MVHYKVGAARDRLSKLWHDRSAEWSNMRHCGFDTAEKLSAFNHAKDWLQDTSEALALHRENGFNPCPHLGYIELYGVLQAAFIQQDAIRELHYAITASRNDIDLFGTDNPSSAWAELRLLRNQLIGHPVNQGKHKHRVSIPRQSITYEHFRYHAKDMSEHSYNTISLGKILDAHDDFAADLVDRLTKALEDQIARKKPAP